MNRQSDKHLPWALTFSYSRALLEPTLKIWNGSESNILAAQEALYHRAKCNSAARRGQYSASMENIKDTLISQPN